MVKNEGDIVEIFVRHNLNFLDALVILENSSSDGTREILMSLVREGLPLCVIDDPEIRYTQSEKTTDLLCSVADIFHPDWVVPLDADEFLIPTYDQTLHDIFSIVPQDNVALIKWKTYVPTPGDDLKEPNLLRRIKYRRKVEDRQWYKVAIPKSLFMEGSLVIDQGNHSVHHVNTTEDCRYFLLTSLAIAHFPVRTADQVLGKAFVGWLAYLCNPNRIEGQGFHWQSLYERFITNQSLSHEELYQIALTYASGNQNNCVIEDPIKNANRDLHYLHLRNDSQLHKIVKMAEVLAKKLSAESKQIISDRVAAHASNDIISPNGGWSKSIHQARLDCDVAPFRYIYERFSPDSVLDIGCGMGTYLRRFKDWGVESVQGIEANDMGDGFLVPGALRVHNLEHPLNIGRTFDLVICAEVIEHLKPKFENTVIDSIAKHANKVIVFSAAQPGQPGLGHINIKPGSYWIELWQNKGWSVLPFASLTFRLLANFSWFKKNTLILVRHEKLSELQQNDIFTIIDLLEAENIKTEWPSQRPGTYEYTLIGDRLRESIIISSPEYKPTGQALSPALTIHSPDDVPPLRTLLRHSLPIAIKKAAKRRLDKILAKIGAKN